MSDLSLVEGLKELAPIVDEEIKKFIPTESFPNLYDGMDYAILSGGKRLRPVLCILTCKALGGDIDVAMPVAIAIEIMHNATLVHDDIEDGDEIRRGSPTVWRKYGIPHATNIGDGMIFKSYESIFNSQLPATKKAEIASMFTKILLEITEGQNMEFNFRQRDGVTADEYLKMARKKAGVLFGFSLVAGANVTDASEKTQTFLHEIGTEIGLAFMIRDDILNLVGEQEKYGKEIGGDIKEGKRTLITIDCLKKCNAEEKQKLLRILKKHRSVVSKDDVEFAIQTIKKYGSIGFAQKYTEDLAKKSKQLLDKLENDELKTILEELSDFIIKREF